MYAAPKKAKKPRKPKQISMFGEPVTAKPKAKSKRKKTAVAFLSDTPRVTHTLTEPVSLHIPGDPQPWTAPLFSGKKGGRAGYRSPELREWYAKVVPIIKAQWIPRAPIGHAVSLEVLFVFPRTRIPAPLRETWPKCREWMVTAPDLSNSVKSCEDAMSVGRGCNMAGVWVDDCLVVEITSARKVIAAEGEESGIYVTIRRVPTWSDVA